MTQMRVPNSTMRNTNVGRQISQNFRTVTGHAGKTRRFLIHADDGRGKAVEMDHLDLPRGMTMHEYHRNEHPLKVADVLITAGCREGFVWRDSHQKKSR